MKRKLLYTLISIILIFGICFLFLKNKNENNTTNTLKVAEVTHSIFYTPFYVAIENGYFKDEGIDIELMLVSGSDNVAASILSNDSDIGLAGPESAIYVYLGKEKNYLQVFAGLTKRDGQFILGRKNKKFNWEDLKGKEILIGRSTGMPGLSFLKALEKQNINNKDVKVNSSVEFSELSGAFLAGTGDYVNLFEPLASKLQNNKEGYVLTSVGLYSSEFPYTAFYARKNYLKENKKLLTKFTKALNKGIDYTLKENSKTIAKSIKKQFNDTKISDLEEMITRYKNADVWLNNTYIDKDFYEELVTLLKDNKLIDKDVPYEKLINNLEKK